MSSTRSPILSHVIMPLEFYCYCSKNVDLLYVCLLMSLFAICSSMLFTTQNTLIEVSDLSKNKKLLT